MAVDLAVWSQGDRSVKKARERYLQLVEGDDTGLNPPPLSARLIAAFIEELTARYPLPNEHVRSVWTGPFERSDAHIIVSTTYEFARELLPVVAELAYRHGLTCYNPATGSVRLPPVGPPTRRR